MALTFTPEGEKNFSCPDFELPAVDGKTIRLNSFDKSRALLVMFICNHCPYVQAIEDRLVNLGRAFSDEDLAVVAISANDPAEYPEDSFENMKRRAEEKGYPFSYLWDETQAIAKAFGAVCTPDFFLFDQSRKLIYRGRLDDNWKSADKVQNQELKTAIQNYLAGQEVEEFPNPSMGCSIKWK